MIFFNYSDLSRAMQEVAHAIECGRYVTIKRRHRFWVVGETEL